MKLKEYYVAQSVEEVVTLINKSRKNIILGGSHWLKMGNTSYNTGIDISELGLNQIEEKESTIIIGGDVSLRQIETNPIIEKYAGILKEAVSSIVGVQFRNTARIGASVFSRFGFSDVTAALLTLDTLVEINASEIIHLEAYLLLPRQRHFITRIFIKKESLQYVYYTMRQNTTSLPYMILGISKNNHEKWRISIGARPGTAILAHKTMKHLNDGSVDLDEACELLVGEIGLRDNIFASQSYREHLAHVFLKRGVEELWK
jgi:CO/xanthine dehydrogenase FAD-binding subunit